MNGLFEMDFAAATLCWKKQNGDTLMRYAALSCALSAACLVSLQQISVSRYGQYPDENHV